MVALTGAAALLATLPLLLVLGYALQRGASALDLAFFTRLPNPAGEGGGGVANAIAGTFVLLGIAAATGLPVGVGAGLYAAERDGTRLAATVRFVADVLAGVPSIVVGIFVWRSVVRPTGGFSALAGGLALGIIVVPLVARATEEVVRLVPASLREAALALGYPHWRTSLGVVLRTALPGVATGMLLALARVAGEAAPLLFTAFGNAFWSLAPGEPIAALPLQIFTYANSPYAVWHRQAWAAALVLVAIVAVVSLAARYATRARFGGGIR
jgi:phosphate transport system permease protein